MAEKLTPQQALAVKNRGGKLLVSAAAGSGKTKVLVDRLMDYLTAAQDPADLDEFLIITYTKAAASELRGKIAAKLTQMLAENPDSRHLQRQMQRLYLTKISTVHGFCADILREYAYRLDIPADFRVADENECRELRESVMAGILEEAYAAADGDDGFRAFLDTQGLGRDDRLIPQILFQVYDSARCHLDPRAWLDRCVENNDFSGVTDLGQTVWGRYLMDDLFAFLDLQIEALTRCADAAGQAVGMEKPAALLRDTVAQLQGIRQCESWDAVYARKKVDYGRLVISAKCPDQALAEQIKAVRGAAKAAVERKLKSFSGDSRQMLEDMSRCAEAIRGMVALVKAFSKEYDRRKRTRRVLDFGDLEHRALDLFTGTDRNRITAAAREVGDRFREVLVDEYQDSNAVQDAIFSALTERRQNCFLVGDVKQSIYQFRLADPRIFLEKYNTFAPAETAKPGEGRRVLLSSNFRSCGGVLEGVNDIFRLCMTPAVGGLHYGDGEALREGIPHVPLEEPEVELLVLSVREHTYDEEAAMVARRIKELLDGSHFVRQGDATRPIRPEDIAVLLRSPGSMGGAFQAALEAEGIRCRTGGGENLLETQEIATLRALLQTVGNPRQDIPLLTVLMSPLFEFTVDDLAVIRGKNREGCLYDALQTDPTPKATAFLKTLSRLRTLARRESVVRLLEEIFLHTRIDSIYAAAEGGNLRQANLQTFYDLAVQFEATGRRELSRFLEMLDDLEQTGLTVSGEESAVGAVTLMSIHKSKGLEFPVVFVSGLSREFNRESLRAQVLCDKELGLGLTAVDTQNRVRYPTAAKRAIQVKAASESLSEEMRVLYVALTRARDRLIMTYAAKKPESDLKEIACRTALGGGELMTRDAICPGWWVLMAAMARTEAGKLFALAGTPGVSQVHPYPWRIETVQSPEEAPRENRPVEEAPADPEVQASIRQGLAFRYGHMAATRAPSKQTATQRKGREKDAEAAENAPPEAKPAKTWRIPAFAGAREDAAAAGTATHLCLQYIRYDSCATEDAVGQEVARLVESQYLTPEQGRMVNCGWIAAFFRTELGKKLRAGQVIREFKFSILDDGSAYDPALAGESILLQGVVDCALLEPDGITVLDFKTDYVTAQSLPGKVAHYRPQLLAYAGALERIYSKPVKDALLYFFRIGEAVSVWKKEEEA